MPRRGVRIKRINEPGPIAGEDPERRTQHLAHHVLDIMRALYRAVDAIHRLQEPDMLLTLEAVVRFAQGVANRTHDPRHPLLHHVIQRPEFQRFDGHLLAKRARDEDERNVRRSLGRDSKRRHSVERWKRIVGQDQIEAATVERGDEFVAHPHERDVAGDASRLEHVADHVGIAPIVLQVQDAKRLIHLNRFLARFPAGAG